MSKTKQVKKAVILSAGFSTRFRPLTARLPKCLLPFWNIPLIYRILDTLNNWGVTDILINLHHAPDPLVQALLKRNVINQKISFSYEPEILGTGGTIKNTRWFTGDDNFWLVNSDIVCATFPARLVTALQKSSAIASSWITHSTGPKTLELKNGFIDSFTSQNSGSKGTATMCGLHLIRNRIHRYILPNKHFSLVALFLNAMRNGEKIAGCEIPNSFWADLGTPSAYLQAHKDILNFFEKKKPYALRMDSWNPNRTASVQHLDAKCANAIEPTAVISKTAKISGSVVMADARIGPNAALKDAIIAHAVSVNAPVSHLVMKANSVNDPTVNESLKKLRWNIDTTIVSLFNRSGSDRSFIRLLNNNNAAILIKHGTARPENDLYAQNARFLNSNGVRVPAVLQEFRSLHANLMQDIGTSHLTDTVRNKNKRNIIAMYSAVLDLIVLMHTKCTISARKKTLKLIDPFSHDLLLWEHNLFSNLFLAKKMKLENALIKKIKNELRKTTLRLLEEPAVLIHRDLQSSNIMIFQNKPWLIDFQGMRFGPALYDLASLLCDPYVRMPENIANFLLTSYAEKMGANEDSMEKLFPVAAIQRLSQAIGAYARLSVLPGGEPFLAHIPPAVSALLHYCKKSDTMPCTVETLLKIKSEMPEEKPCNA